MKRPHLSQVQLFRCFIVCNIFSTILYGYLYFQQQEAGIVGIYESLNPSIMSNYLSANSIVYITCGYAILNAVVLLSLYFYYWLARILFIALYLLNFPYIYFFAGDSIQISKYDSIGAFVDITGAWLFFMLVFTDLKRRFTPL